MIDKSHIGHVFPAFETTIEAGRVRLFCKAIGEANPLHLDAAVARAAGYRNILAPITFPTAIVMDSPNPRALIELLHVNIAWILHGEEHYDYFAPICVEDRITAQLRITDIYDKKGGALEFIVAEFEMTNHLQEKVSSVRRSLVVRRPHPAQSAPA
jgi:acyl dehydratase